MAIASCPRAATRPARVSPAVTSYPWLKTPTQPCAKTTCAPTTSAARKVRVNPQHIHMLSCFPDILKGPLLCHIGGVCVTAVRFLLRLPHPCFHPRLACHQTFTTNRSHQSICTWWLYTVSGTVSCESYDCPTGYSLIDDADSMKCKKGKCTRSVCCNTFCSSFDCPSNFSPVEDSDTTVCKNDKCSRGQCCEQSEIPAPA